MPFSFALFHSPLHFFLLGWISCFLHLSLLFVSPSIFSSAILLLFVSPSLSGSCLVLVCLDVVLVLVLSCLCLVLALVLASSLPLPLSFALILVLALVLILVLCPCPCLYPRPCPCPCLVLALILVLCPLFSVLCPCVFKSAQLYLSYWILSTLWTEVVMMRLRLDIYTFIFY